MLQILNSSNARRVLIQNILLHCEMVVFTNVAHSDVDSQSHWSKLQWIDAFSTIWLQSVVQYQTSIIEVIGTIMEIIHHHGQCTSSKIIICYRVKDDIFQRLRRLGTPKCSQWQTQVYRWFKQQLFDILQNWGDDNILHACILQGKINLSQVFKLLLYVENDIHSCRGGSLPEPTE